MTDETGTTEVRDTLIVNTAALLKQPPSCLRDNECSQQQLVRLVGYRGPSVDTAASLGPPAPPAGGAAGQLTSVHLR